MEEQLLALLGLVFVPVTCVLTVLWRTARRRAERAEAIVQQVAIALAARGSLSGPELGPAVDAIALEVERIGEGQRFVTQLLEARAARDAVAAAQHRSVTPH
jgi:hypothetical protein